VTNLGRKKYGCCDGMEQKGSPTCVSWLILALQITNAVADQGPDHEAGQP